MNPRSFGRYEVCGRLGEGGMGQVWLAHDPKLDRPVAIKTLPAHVAGDERMRRRFRREALATARIRHPHVAELYDSGEDKGFHYLCFEFVEGQSLRERLHGGPMPVGEVVELGRQLASGLAAVHEAGVLHRDLTSNNVMLRRDGRAVLIDFGLASGAELSQISRTGDLSGTAGFIAPEVLMGTEPGRSGDLYALGVLLYHALTARLPFEAPTAAGVVEATVHEHPEPPSRHAPGIPPGLEALVMELLAKDPSARPPDAHAVVGRLVRTREELEGLELGPTSTFVAPARSASARRSWRRPLVLAAAGLALALVAWFATSRLAPPGPGDDGTYVAVLPFEDLSPDPGEQAWLVEGLGTQLVERLQRVPGVRATPWESSRRYSTRQMELGEIAGALGTELLLTGQFRFAGGRIQGTTSLVDPATGYPRWTQEFQGELAQLFAVLSEVAGEAGEAMVGRLQPDTRDAMRRDPTALVAAFELYTTGAKAMYETTGEGTNRARAYFERAVELDPDYADAWVGLGSVHTENYYHARGGGERNLAMAEEHFRRAMELDPHHHRGLAGLSTVAWARGDWVRAMEIVQEAPWAHGEDIHSLQVRAHAYFVGGLPGRSVRLLERMVEVDPANHMAHWFLPIARFWAGDPAGSLEAADLYFQRFPRNDAEIRMWRALARSSLGQHRMAAQEIRLCRRAAGDENLHYYRLYEGVVHHLRGDAEAARKCWREGLGWAERRLAAYPDHRRLREIMAALHGWLGQVEEAQAMLEGLPKPDGYDEQLLHYEEISWRLAAGQEEAFKATILRQLPWWGYPEQIEPMVRLIGRGEYLDSEDYAPTRERALAVRQELRRRFTY